jgi:hypothetical protein
MRAGRAFKHTGLVADRNKQQTQILEDAHWVVQRKYRSSGSCQGTAGSAALT